MTPDQRESLAKIFLDTWNTRGTQQASCEWCGGYHLRACPRLRRIVFMAQGAGTGNVTEVEFWNHKDVDWSEVIWPEEVFDNETPEVEHERADS